jgi:hypothetical protein
LTWNLCFGANSQAAELRDILMYEFDWLAKKGQGWVYGMKSLEMLAVLVSKDVVSCSGISHLSLWLLSPLILLLCTPPLCASALLAKSSMDVERRIAPIKTKRTSVSFAPLIRRNQA